MDAVKTSRKPYHNTSSWVGLLDSASALTTRSLPRFTHLMDSVATTKAEADAHLETLRQKRGVGREQPEESVLVQSLDQALKMRVLLSRSMISCTDYLPIAFPINSTKLQHISFSS